MATHEQSSGGSIACLGKLYCSNQIGPALAATPAQSVLATGVLQAKRGALEAGPEAVIPTLAQLVSVLQKLGQQHGAHDLLLEAASILSEQRPEFLTSKCPV